MEDRIKPLAQELHKKRLHLEKTLDDMKSIKAAHFIDIHEMSKDREEAIRRNLNNEKLRDIALDDRLELDPEYTRLDNVKRALENDIALLAIDLEHERHSFEVWKIMELQKVMGLV
jgi:hypothetical protein